MLPHFPHNLSAETAIVIRGYVPADWPQVCRVHDLARVQELALGGVDARAFRTMEEAAEADEFFISETLVACCGEALVGFVSWNGSYITWLYVDPEYQCRGIGGSLLREALHQVGPEGWTNMLAGNEPALSLYRKFGLEVVWIRPSKVEGYTCSGMRLALCTSRMYDPAAKRHATNS